MTTITTDETWRRLNTVAHLLHHAAAKVWERADQLPADAELQSFGLAVYLARSQAIELVPLDYQLPDDVAGDLDLEGQTASQLLAAAEQHTRGLPVHQPDFVVGQQLIVDLCDLAREARDHGL